MTDKPEIREISMAEIERLSHSFEREDNTPKREEPQEKQETNTMAKEIREILEGSSQIAILSPDVQETETPKVELTITTKEVIFTERKDGVHRQKIDLATMKAYESTSSDALDTWHEKDQNFLNAFQEKIQELIKECQKEKLVMYKK